RKGQIKAELERIRAGLDASEYSYEIVVVDDGSGDETGSWLREIDGIRLIQFDHPRGTRTARKAGTEAARGNVVVWTDADLSYPNDEIPRLVGQLEGWDQVVGERLGPRGRPGRARAVARASLQKMASYLAETKIPDLNSSMRAFRADVGRQYL